MNLWLERKYIDFWSTVHFLTGCAMAGFFEIINISIYIALPIAIILMILWEFYEDKKGIKEQTTNKGVDVIIGLIGFFIMIELIKNFHPLKLTIGISIIWISLILVGNNYLKKKGLSFW